MKTATKAQVMRLANKLGVTVEDNTSLDTVDICIITPDGYSFKANFIHSCVTYFPRLQRGDAPNPYEGTKADAWADVMETLEMGIEECTEPNCGYCERGLANV